MAGPQGNIINRGYLFPDKGKGRLNINGRDVNLTSKWASEDKLRVEFEVAAASGSAGFVTPNGQKSNDRQPDWRGRLKDDQGKDWLVSIWNKNKDGDLMFSLSLTDPASLPPRESTNAPAASGTPAPAPVSSAPAPAAAPPADPNAMPPVGTPNDFNFDFGDIFSQPQ
jgi:hypothetical protein